jgi:mRNA interferase RelE/StbE
MSEHYKILISRAAWKELMQFEESQQFRFFDAIEALEGNPRPDGCTKLAGDENFYRVRVGNYRIVYEIRDSVLIVTVVKVRHRREVYRKNK